MGNELRAIVHPQMGRCWIQLEELLNRVDHVHCRTPTANPNRQADAAEFIDHVQELQRAAIHHLIELEVDRPDVVRVFRAQQLSAATGRPGALPPARQGPLQTFLTSDPLQSLVIDVPAIKPQPPVNQAPAPAHMAAGQLTDPPFELLLLDIYQRHRAALGIAVLSRQPAGTPLRNPESILQNHHGPATTLRA